VSSKLAHLSVLIGVPSCVTGSRQDDSSLQTCCGTPAFVAPEVAAQTGYGTSADWWSLGVLLYQCLTCCTPFEGPDVHATMDNVIHHRRVHVARVHTGDGAPPIGVLSLGATALIDALLHPDPTQRLGGQLRGNEIRVHRFFWGFDWAKLYKRQMTPPHAARCRDRAVAATQHPGLQLPPLPNFSPEVGHAPCDVDAVPTCSVVPKQDLLARLRSE
jgi:serine/threonine protein kinase